MNEVCVKCGDGHTGLNEEGICFECSYVKPSKRKAKTEIIGSNLEQLPFEGLEEIGKIFAEGAKKYGYDNWKLGVSDPDYQQERLRHAIRHLMLYANDDRSENHLAKVGWFCVTQLWLEKH